MGRSNRHRTVMNNRLFTVLFSDGQLGHVRQLVQQSMEAIDRDIQASSTIIISMHLMTMDH